MRPIFEQAALGRRAPGGAVEQRAIIGAEARESGKIVGSGEDVDAVDLVEAEPLDGAGEMAAVRARGSGNAETLGGESDSPSGSEGDAVARSAHGAA